MKGTSLELGPTVFLGNPASFADTCDVLLERFAEGEVFRPHYGGNGE
jgi:hypothetical protein